MPRKRPDLYIIDILRWADAHFRRTGKWPNVNSGRVPETEDDTWRRIDDALAKGYRGLPRNSGWTLARLLEKHRGVRNSEFPPPLDVAQIFAWAAAHHRRAGRWPVENSGPLKDVPGETWTAIDLALRRGTRGLPGGGSLAILLDEHGVVRNLARLPRLRIGQILEWADAHFQRTGRWPNRNSGPIEGADREQWGAVNSALRNGRRGLRRGSSLEKLLRMHRSVKTRMLKSPLSLDRVWDWCVSHHQRTGRWPTRRSGRVAEAPEESWGAIDSAFRSGYRGLGQGPTLARFIARRR